MKIGIDARLYGAKHGGIGRYIEQLLKQLQKIDKQNEYVIFLSADNFNSFKPTSSNFYKIKANYKAYGFKEQLFFPFLLYFYKLDLMHFMHFNAPFLYYKKYVLTIHDLIISHYPDSRATTLPKWLYKIKLIVYNALIKKIAGRANLIITVSFFSKNDIIKTLGIKKEKIKVIYEAANGGNLIKKIKQSPTKPYFLYVGSAYPHKNLDTLIIAFNKFNYAKKYNLLVVGKKSFFYNRLIEKYKNYNNIRFVGFASEQKLEFLYNNALAYVFPSIIEGFGLPALEAQKRNLPVLSSNIECLKEILGDSALYFNPLSVEDIALKMKIISIDNELRKRLIKKGLSNADKYSWNKCAIKTLKEYCKLF